ncbi:antibiotic biosynthesis monooxygenase [Micromonospora sp. WMMD882]|nr:antibiotic biosynthesis monooxygenase family protein [Micromonospora sp. WMMD882]WBB82104.1 antibiotic biosynthesis monooxygenase [Micromonospora sp. WMMD882]
MLRVRARPGCGPAVESAWRSIAGQVGGSAGNLRRELLQNAARPGSYVVVTEWVDESTLHDYEHGPVAARLADALRPLCEPAGPDDRRVMRDPAGGVPEMIFVDVEMRVPDARRAEFERGHAEVRTRMAGVPGYLREELLRVPGSEVAHIFAEWRSAADFHRWVANPAHAREEAGPIADFLLRDFRRRLFHPMTRPDDRPLPVRPAGRRGAGRPDERRRPTGDGEESDMSTTTGAPGADEARPVRTVLAMRTRPGCERRFEDEWLTVAEKIRTLDGCLRQDLVRDADDPRRYLIISDWADRDRLDAFGRSEHRDHLLRVIRDLRESAERHTYHVLHSVGGDPGAPR